MIELRFPPGTPVAITQSVRLRDKVVEKRTEGVVEEWDDLPTGSWFAHAKNDKLWLKRLKLRKPDGEITLLVIDNTTRIQETKSPAGTG